MRCFKKILSLVLAVLMVLTVPISAAAEDTAATDTVAEPMAGSGSGDTAVQEAQEAIPEGEEAQEAIPDVTEEADVLDASSKVVWLNYADSSGTGTGYVSLQAALNSASVKDGAVLTLTGDLEISERLSVTKSVTLTDDGTPHRITVCNTNPSDDADTGYGRGIQINSGKTVTLQATEPGNLTVVGHDADGANYNTSAVFFVYNGTLNLTNVTITECCCSAKGPITTYSSGSNIGNVILENCRITGNITSDSCGAGVYNCGTMTLKGNTDITKNYSVSSGSNRLSNAAVLSGGNLVVDGSFCGSVGVDAGVCGEAFGSVSGAPILDGLVRDRSPYLYAVVSGTSLLWKNSSISVAVGSFSEADTSDSLSYRMSDVIVTMVGKTTCGALSIMVDTGTFSLPADALGSAVIRTWLAADGSEQPASLPATLSGLQGLTLSGCWSSEEAQTLLESITFSVPYSGMTQNLTCLLLPELPENGTVLGGSTYCCVSDPCTLVQAQCAASDAGGQLACVFCAPVNRLLSSLASADTGYWLGGRLLSDNWYWADGTRITASSVSSQGYLHSYTQWADGQPGSGTGLALQNGFWTARSPEDTLGYILEIPDEHAFTAAHTAVAGSPSRPTLASVSLSLKDNICINYSVRLPENYQNSALAAVTVTVGSNDPVSYPVSSLQENTSLPGTYKISVPVKPVDLNADVSIAFTDADGDISGYFGGQDAIQYNVRWYADYVIRKGSEGDSGNASYSPALVQMMKALLNYGAAAQAQFLAEPGVPANTGYEDTSGFTSPEAIAGAVLSNTSAAADYTIELIADDSTVIRIRPQTEGSFSVSVDGTAWEVMTDEEGAYIDIPVYPAGLSRTYTAVFSGGFSDTLQFNAIAVVQRILQDTGASDTQKNTADRLYRLSLAANTYFGVYTPAASAVEAVVNTAFAYLANTSFIQYDQHQMTKDNTVISGHSNSRRQLDVSPSDATEQNTVYLDCSSFCWNVYREVFGESAVLEAFGLTQSGASDFTTSNLLTCSNADIVVNIYDPSDAAAFAQLRSDLQPGDLIVKYKSSTSHGHVVLWVGSGYVHCTGSSYDYDTGTDNPEENGAVYYVPQSEFDASWYSGNDSLMVLRPLNALSDVTDAGTARQQNGALSAAKTMTCDGAALANGRSVAPGAEIQVQLTLSNPKQEGLLPITRTVTVTDVLPTGATLVCFGSDASSAAGVQVASQLTWNAITLAAGASCTLTYTIKVTGSVGSTLYATEAACISAEAGDYAKAIEFSCCDLPVENQLSDVGKNTLLTLSQDMAGSSCSDALSSLNTLLADVTGSDPQLGSADEEWVDALFDKTSSGAYFYVNPDKNTVFWKYLVANFASGRRVLNYSSGGGAFDSDTRVRNLTTDNLSAGDVLAVCLSSNDDFLYRYYIYLGGDQMLYLQSGKTSAVVSAADVLDNLLNKTCFAVFRMTRLG